MRKLKQIKKMHHSRVLIEKRHKPMAEDMVLGYLAKERYANSTERNYVDITTVLKKRSL